MGGQLVAFERLVDDTQRAAFALSPRGRLYNALGWVFSVYCVYKVVMATRSILKQGAAAGAALDFDDGAESLTLDSSTLSAAPPNGDLSDEQGLSGDVVAEWWRGVPEARGASLAAIVSYWHASSHEAFVTRVLGIALRLSLLDESYVQFWCPSPQSSELPCHPSSLKCHVSPLCLSCHVIRLEGRGSSTFTSLLPFDHHVSSSRITPQPASRSPRECRPCAIPVLSPHQSCALASQVADGVSGANRRHDILISTRIPRPGALPPVPILVLSSVLIPLTPWGMSPACRRRALPCGSSCKWRSARKRRSNTQLPNASAAR